jgi:hypothetical protein
MANSSTVTRPNGVIDRCNGQGMSDMRPAPKTTATVAELRARIERGRYEVKPHRVADAMLRRGISFRPLRPGARRG